MDRTTLVSAPLRFVMFRLSEQAYVLPTQAVDEIVSMAELSRPPCAPAMLAGFLNFGGEPVAVINLRRLFDLPALEPGLYTPLVILKHELLHIALQVDEVMQIIGESDSRLIPLGERCCLNDAATATLEVNGETAIVLSPERLLLDAERLKLTELQEIERNRLKTISEVATCS
jgi:purine-binding chemotaxis protein CheW